MLSRSAPLIGELFQVSCTERRKIVVFSVAGQYVLSERDTDGVVVSVIA